MHGLEDMRPLGYATDPQWRASWDSAVSSYQVHQGPIEAATWSPVSPEIASCGVDGGVHVWNAITGATRLVYQGHSDMVRVLAYAPDGCHIASGSEDGEVHVWHAATGSLLHCFLGHRRPVIALCWSPDGTRVASADETVIRVWSMQQETEGSHEIGKAEECIFTALGWTTCQQEHVVLSASEGCLYRWNVLTGDLLSRWDYSQTGEILLGLAVSPDGMRAALATDDATVLLVHAQTGAILLRHRVALDASWGLCWSPCGTFLASGGYQQVEVWNTHSGEVQCRYTGHTAEVGVNAVVWSPDGTQLASLDGAGRAHVWEVPVPVA